MKYFLGIDSGSTKYLIKARGTEGNLLASATGTTANHRIIGAEGAAAQIRSMVEGLLSSFGGSPVDCLSLVAGSAGIDSKNDKTLVEGFYSALGLSCPIICLNDAIIPLYASTGGVGIQAIAGTGSIVVGRNAKGGFTRSGGYSTVIFGDEGSGRWIALMAMRHASRWIDKSVGDSPLTAKLDSFFGGLDANTLSECTARYKKEPVEIELAVLVEEAAKEGDPHAAAILKQGAHELFDLARSCVVKLGFDREEAFKAGVWGSVFTNNELFLTEYRDLFARYYPGGEVIFPPGDAADGALALARDYLDGKAGFIDAL